MISLFGNSNHWSSVAADPSLRQIFSVPQLETLLSRVELWRGLNAGKGDLGSSRSRSSRSLIYCKRLMEKEGTLNTTSSTFEKEECFLLDPIPLKIVRICAYCIVIFVSLTGNLLIIIVTRKIKMTRRKSIHYLIVNMAVADIFLTLYMPRVVSLVYAGFEWQVDGIPG